MGEKIDRFQEQRRKMNERILATGTLQTQRFWALDSRVYEAGALDVRTKEMLGLVSSTVVTSNPSIAACKALMGSISVTMTRAPKPRSECAEPLPTSP